MSELVGGVDNDDIVGKIENDSQINVTVTSIGKEGSYVHPLTHPASMIEETDERMFMTLTEKTDIQDLKDKEGFVHDQMVSVSEWVITHNLGRYPAVTVVDSSGNVVVGEVLYTGLNSVRIVFTSEFSGKAYFN